MEDNLGAYPLEQTLYNYIKIICKESKHFKDSSFVVKYQTDAFEDLLLTLNKRVNTRAAVEKKKTRLAGNYIQISKRKTANQI